MKLIDKIDSLNSDDIKVVFKELIKDYFSPAFGSISKRDLDILLFSNIISSKKENARTNGYVWVSFDGGKSWPLKKSVDKGNFAYSSMIAGRPGTVSEGMIFLLYESESGAKLARFNLQWLLDGVDISTYLKL